MKINDLISIVIPCYNDAKFIDQAIDSALSQTHSNKEIIVVDDGSNQKTKDILKGLESKIDILITQENQGQSTARNEGIKAAHGEYILILDSDDFFETMFSEKAVNVFLEKNDIKLVTCYANLLFENETSSLYKPNGGKLEDFLFVNQALGTSMFRKKDWELCGGYDESMREGFEDWEFFIRLLARGGVAYVIKEPLYNYRKRSDSTTTKANSKKYRLLKHIYIKNKDLYIDKFETTIHHLIKRIEREEKEKIKNTERLEFKIGKAVLMPLRWVKSLLR
ncbi:glycosyltransferase [Hwangdonia lutea]|uniref:Glycosyltransferase n=1 Tax=Hwangdonia lutea TaxID=3075823 RepID=A0AA97EMD8_9FLAO|nr:glycosyltransferase [Hwangdonia sp. SCSIO 19198]WOD43977.1 glycosyltransferase [Hwangdonia sp. SCSIO 19198]